MAEPKRPYTVTFTSDPIPTTVDHSQKNPGPATGADRAGYTNVRHKPRMEIDWQVGKPRGDGSVPLWAETAVIEFRLFDYTVGISSDYPVGSCAYEATLKHELDAHIRRPIEIFYAHRDPLIGLLDSAPLPTKDKPRWVKSDLAEAEQEKLVAPVKAAIVRIRDRITAAMKADRAKQDAPDSYDLVYNQCTPDEWAAGATP